MNLGDIVVVLNNDLIGVDDFYPVKGEVGIITDYEKETDMYEVKTLDPITSGWWYTREQLGTPTAEDYRRRLKEALAEIYFENYVGMA